MVSEIPRIFALRAENNALTAGNREMPARRFNVPRICRVSLPVSRTTSSRIPRTLSCPAHRGVSGRPCRRETLAQCGAAIFVRCFCRVRIPFVSISGGSRRCSRCDGGAPRTELWVVFPPAVPKLCQKPVYSGYLSCCSGESRFPKLSITATSL